MANTRNNVIAGAFVLAGVGLAVFVSFVLADRSSYAATRSFTVRFTLSQGALGLKRGSSVNLAGQKIGRVLDVDFRRAKGGVPDAVDVRVEIRSDLTIYESATISLEKPLLGTLSSINISDVGTPGAVLSPQHNAVAIDEGDVVAGTIAPPSFLADAGFGPSQSSQVQHAITSVEASVQRLSELIDRSAPAVESGVADARLLLTDLRTSIDQWSASVRTVLANAETTSINLSQASARLDPLLTKADAGLDDARAIVASVRTLVDDNKARVQNAIASMESAAGKIDQETVASVNAALKDGKDALHVLSESVSRISALVGEQTPSVRRTLANLRLMSDQLKLTAVEIRSQPWRLLQSPTTKELNAQVLYDATRSYAEAASDLRAASESLEAAAALAGRPDAPSLADLSAKLAETLARYRQAEQHLFDRLLEAEK